MSTLRRLWLLCLVVGVSFPSYARGQEAEAGFRTQVYRMSEPDSVWLSDVRLLSSDVAGVVPLTPWLAASVRAGYAHAEVILPNGASSSVSGFTDGIVRLTAVRGRFSVDASAIVPTGKVVQSAEEAAVVGVLSSDLMPFALGQWGSGGGGAIDVTYVRRLSWATLSLSAGHAERFGSHPLGTSDFTFRPGGQSRLRASLEAPVGEAGIVNAMLGVQRFSSDEYAGGDVFSPGLRMEGHVSYAFALGLRESALVFAGVHALGAGTAEGVPGQEDIATYFPGAVEQPSRSVWVLGAQARIGRTRVAWMPTAAVQLVRSSSGRSQSWITSLGGSAEYRILGHVNGRRLVAEPGAMVRLGRLVAEDPVASPIVGWELGLTLRWVGP
jgi:hypothetical protein